MQYKAQIMSSRDIRRPFIALTSNELVLQDSLFASNKHAEHVHETASAWCGIALYLRLFWGTDSISSFIGYRENALETGSKFVLQNSTSPMVQFGIKQTQVSRVTSIMWPCKVAGNTRGPHRKHNIHVQERIAHSLLPHFNTLKQKVRTNNGFCW